MKEIMTKTLLRNVCYSVNFFFVNLPGNFIAFSVSNEFKNYLMFCGNWLVVISTASFTELIFNR